jgi:hypothetical protein
LELDFQRVELSVVMSVFFGVGFLLFMDTIPLLGTKRKESFDSLHYKHLQLCPERKCKIGIGKTYTQFYRKWSEVKNKLY